MRRRFWIQQNKSSNWDRGMNTKFLIFKNPGNIIPVSLALEIHQITNSDKENGHRDMDTLNFYKGKLRTPLPWEVFCITIIVFSTGRSALF